MAAPKLVFVVTEDWYFYSHRRPMIAAAQECGFEVTVVTNVDKHREKIEGLGVKVVPFAFERRSLNPLKALWQVAKLWRIYRREKPEIVHHIAMKPILLGSFAAGLAGVPCVVNAFAGLGYVFNARAPLADALRVLLWLPFYTLFQRRNTWLLFQNQDDLETLKALNLVKQDRTCIIKGSGVDLNEFPARPMREPAPDFICVYAGRMIGIKGLPTLREAFALLEETAPNVKLHLYGKPDNANPGSWTEADIADWVAESNNVVYKGHAPHMAPVWEGAHVAIQASYGGEGVPKSLLEAAACGRPIVATDVPGCREVVIVGDNGLLVPPYNAQALADALAALSKNWNLCRRMGTRSLRMVENGMSAESVKFQTMDFYQECMAKAGLIG